MRGIDTLHLQQKTYLLHPLALKYKVLFNTIRFFLKKDFHRIKNRNFWSVNNTRMLSM